MRILNKEMLTDHGNIEGRRIVTALLDAGMDALDPYARVKKLVRMENGKILLDDREFEMKEDPHAGPAAYDLRDIDRIFVIGAGKGVQRAALGLEEVLGDRLTGGHVIGKHGEEILLQKIGVTLAGHPVPDEYCVEGCKRIEEFSKGITSRDLVFTVFGSGCGSLCTYPAGDITIQDIAEFTRMMQIEKGVPTSDLNPIRTHIDRFKGGRINRLFQPARQIHLVTADPSKLATPALRVTYREMLENNTFFPPLCVPCTYGDCIEIIRRWNAWDRTPPSIRTHLLQGGTHNENMSVEEFEGLGQRFFGLIFKDATIYPAVRRKAAEFSLPCQMLCEYEEAEAAEAGRINAAIALTAERLSEPFSPPVVLMSSGENVVTVGKNSGVGGRNQEYCTRAALKIAGSRRIVIGAVDTDGTDGPGGFRFPGAPECLAGAVVDGYTAEEARQAGIDLEAGLQTHGTSEALWRLHSGVSASASISALDLRVILIMGDQVLSNIS